MDSFNTLIAIDKYTKVMKSERSNLLSILQENGWLENAFERLGVRDGMETIERDYNSVRAYVANVFYPFLVVHGHPPTSGGELEAASQMYYGVQELCTMLSSILVRLTFFMLEREELIEPFDQFRMLVKNLILADSYRSSPVLNRVDNLLEECRAKFFEQKANRLLQGFMPAQRIEETTFSYDDRARVLTGLLKKIVKEIIRLTSICQFFNKPFLVLTNEVTNSLRRRAEECRLALTEIGEQELTQDLRFVFAYQVDNEYWRAIEFLNEMTEDSISCLWAYMGRLAVPNTTRN